MFKNFALILLVLSFSFEINAQDARKYKTHVVKEGESLKSIAKYYDCKVKELKDLNPDIDDDTLFVNSAIVVPNNNKVATVEKIVPKNQDQIIIYIVELGNTVYSIAKKFNVTMQSLRAANNLQSDDLVPGQKLRIPSTHEFAVKPLDSKVEFYQVKKGDTKWRIATLYNIKVEELDDLNPDYKGELQENQYIWVPSKDKVVKTEIAESYQVEHDPSFIYHVVKNGEGLFKIAVLYSTTQEEIEKLNPEAVKKLRPGMLLKIPGKKKDKFLTHEVVKGDTFFSLTKKYKVSEEHLLLYNPELVEGLKLGTTIYVKPKEEKKNIFNNTKFIEKDLIKISFMMPIMSDSTFNFGKKTTDSQLRTIVTDFYLGAQMAIEEFKNKGINIEYHVYDTKNDSKTVLNLVQNKSIQESDVIIGPFFFDKAEIVADKLPEIPVVSPLYSKKQDTNHQTNLIKAGVDYSNMTEALIEFLIENYTNQKVILITDYQETNLVNAKEIINTLNSKNISIQKIEPIKNSKNEQSLYLNKTNLINALSEVKENWVILISNNNTVNTEVISTLAINSNNKIRLFTGNQIENFDNINFNHLVKLSWSFPAVQFDAIFNAELEKFKNNYREKNYAFPETYSYTGFDLTYDIIARLASGDFINSLENEETKRLTRKYYYKKTPYADYVNKGVLIYFMNQNFQYELAK